MREERDEEIECMIKRLGVEDETLCLLRESICLET